MSAPNACADVNNNHLSNNRNNNNSSNNRTTVSTSTRSLNSALGASAERRLASYDMQRVTSMNDATCSVNNEMSIDEFLIDLTNDNDPEIQ